MTKTAEKNIKRTLFAIIAARVLLFPVLISAQENKHYFMEKGGMYSYAGRLRNADFKVEFVGGVAYGYYLFRNIVLEAETGYFHDGVNIDFGNEVKGIPVILTAKFLCPAKNAELFAGIGAAAYSVTLHGKVKGITVAETDVIDASDTVFGGHVVLGANLDVFHSIFLGVEGKYIITETARLRDFHTRFNGYTATTLPGFRF